MDNKRLGIILAVLAVVVGGIFLNIVSNLDKKMGALNCNPSAACQQTAAGMGYIHIGMGALGAILSLGLYLIFFNTSEKAILERLEAEKDKSIAEERLAIMLKTLDNNEKIIFKAVAEYDGITQKTLRLKTGLSKAKISQVVTAFEKRGLVKRELNGKTYSIYLLMPV